MFTKAATSQKVLAGEMEGYGVFKECKGYSYNIPCLIIKAICDWGVAKSIEPHENGSVLKDKIQAFATSCSCKILEKMLQKNVFFTSLFEEAKSIIKTELDSGNKSIGFDRLMDNLSALSIVVRCNMAVTEEFLFEIINELLTDKVITRISAIQREIETDESLTNAVYSDEQYSNEFLDFENDHSELRYEINGGFFNDGI